MFQILKLRLPLVDVLRGDSAFLQLQSHSEEMDPETEKILPE
jgi:hypothetical protein